MADLATSKVYGDLTVTGEIAGDGANLTNLNATNLATGTVDAARLPAAALIGDTTYSAGNGLTLSGTAFSLPVTTSGSGSFVTGVTQTTTGITVGLGTPPNTNTTYAVIPAAEITTGTATTLRTISGATAKLIADRNVGTANPLMNNAVAVGTSLLYSRQDHVHPVDTSRAAASHSHTVAWGAGTTAGPTLSVQGGTATAIPIATATASGAVTNAAQTFAGDKTFNNTVNAATFNATSTTSGGFQGIAADAVGTPSFTWTGDLTTGMYRIGASDIGFAAGGVLRGRVNANGFVGVGTSLTALNATQLTSGTVPDARLTGTYTNFTHRLDGSNTIFTLPNAGSTNTAARTVYGLAEYRSSAGSQVGAIVFIAPNTTSTIMHQLDVQGLLYNQNIVRVSVQGYRTSGAWSDARRISTGTVDIQTRWGVTPDGKNCLILGDVGTSWSYPHLSIVRAMFSHGNANDTYCSGWTVAVVTDLSLYTNVTANIADSTMVGSISGNAVTAGGLAVNTTGTNNVANQIMRTQANGYANFGWINTTSGVAGTISRIYCSQDAYIRYLSPAAFKTQLGLDGSGFTITTTGASKTLALDEFCTVTAAGLTLTLPASPAAGANVKIGVNTFTNIIVARNAQNIMGLAENMTIDAANVSVTFTFVDATRGWRVS